MGDRLDPLRITALLGTKPTVAYRKGEIYRRVREHEVRGRSGLWWVSSKGRVNSVDLRDHLDYLLVILSPPNGPDLIDALRGLMEEDGLKADVDCFWYGKHGAQAPEIPEATREVFARLPAPIELDFGTD